MPADAHEIIEELRPIVEAAAEYRAAQLEWVAGLEAQKAGRPAPQDEVDAVTLRSVKATDAMVAACEAVGMGEPRSYPGPMCRFVETYVAPLLTAYEELERRLALAEAVVDAAKAEVVAQGYRSSDMARALEAHSGEFWFEEHVESPPARCPWTETVEVDDGPLTLVCAAVPHGTTPHHLVPSYALAAWRRATEREEEE